MGLGPIFYLFMVVFILPLSILREWVGNDMRRVPEKLQDLIAPTVDSLGYQLVGIEYLNQGKHSLLRIYIDSEAGITVDDCSRVSHQVAGLLDVEDVVKGHYNLEISSPGLDRPIFTIDQFKRFIGHIIKIQLLTPLDGRHKFRGQLRAVKNDVVIIDVDGTEFVLPVNNITKANIVPDLGLP